MPVELEHFKDQQKLLKAQTQYLVLLHQPVVVVVVDNMMVLKQI